MKKIIHVLAALFCILIVNPAFALLTTPSLLTPLSASTNNAPNVLLDWSGSTGATEYQYKLGTNATLLGASSQTVSGSSQINTASLLFGVVYYWQVRAIKSSSPIDSSAWSTIWNFTTVNNFSLLSPLNGASNLAPNELLDWAGISGITAYDYQWDTTASFNSPLSFYASTGTTSSVNAFSLRFGTKYFWRVRARHSADTTQWSATWSFATVDNLNLVSPLNGAINLEPNILLDWAGISGITAYDYQWDTTASFNSPLSFYASTGTTSSVNAFNLRFGSNYFWRVRARHSADTTQWSATWSFTTVDNLNLVSPFNGAVNLEPNILLDWAGISGITAYDYQWDTTASFNSPLSFYASTGTTSSVNAFNLRFGSNYFWRVRARHSADTTQWSATWSFTTVDNLNLVSPFNGAVNLEPNILLDWAGISGITAYDYQWDTTASFNSPLSFYASTGTTSSVNAFNLRFGSNYFWRVRARHSADTTQWSATWSFTTVDNLNLVSPFNGAVNLEPNILLDWAGISGITAYDYQWDTTASFNSPISFYASTGATSTVNAFNLRFGSKYFWRVRARHSADTTQWSATWNFTILEYLTHVSPINNSTGLSLNPTIDWSATSGILAYQYRYSTSGNFSNPSQFTSGLTSQAGLINLSYGTQYYWQVRALHAADTSEWSLPWSFTTTYQITNAPSLISPLNNTTTIALAGTVLQWGAVSSATFYEFQLDDTSTFSSPFANTNTGLNDFSGILLPNKTYYWRVRAGNASGYSPWSLVWSFTTEVNTGLTENQVANNYSIYPNPSNGSFQLISREGAAAKNLRIEIYDTVGKLIYKDSIVGALSNVDINNVPKGLFYLKIFEGDSFYSKIMVVQ